MTLQRDNRILVVLIDGTFASLEDERRSSVGKIHGLLRGDHGPLDGVQLRLHYMRGQQWNSWRTIPDLIMGQGLTMRIVHAYTWLARNYRPGDRIFLFGYSRGAFAIRSLAGMISRVGLLRQDRVTDRNVRLAWRYYSEGGLEQAMARFRHRRAHDSVPIRMVGCFDTVMALGIRLPLLWMLTEPRFRFHDTHLGPDVQYGFQALALNETRAAFAPILWDDSSQSELIEQMWFKGAHADIGGQLNGLEFARPLANIPLVWMLERAEFAGLPLPKGWKRHFPCDVTAPSVGSWRNWGKAFLARARRVAGQQQTEMLHSTVPRPYPGPARLIGHLAEIAAAPGEGGLRGREDDLDPAFTAKPGEV
ncbi:DUF2235 domain-containing protein [Paracoccus onubensis]|uniref:DUF2235 domain-containing protein n=1 Tax=Paracoccus onubensis TaxID=1675788 RepID=A0A418SXQ5_9RHOB|nr:DUF2235 domain-containing protein [Paracoccus onubensis]RJE85744.1 DUF2235 domain-containing protein [Paracoccus onubensis]